MSDDSSALDEAIQSYYDRPAEEDRLLIGPPQIEAERTRGLIQRFAPSPPAVVLDVGGASGAYALWLASLGYEVHLLDPIPRLVQLAEEGSESATHPLASTQVGDARKLPFEDSSVDCVLMLGPLYHLTTSEDRALALSEARRVLRSGGFLLAACITRWASLLNGLMYDRLADPRFVPMIEEDLRSGQHRNPTEHAGYFTTSYFHTPSGFEEELRASTLRIEGVFGLEGPAHLLSDFDERWADERQRADLLRVAAEIEAEPAFWGLSPHLLGVCRKE